MPNLNVNMSNDDLAKINICLQQDQKKCKNDKSKLMSMAIDAYYQMRTKEKWRQ